MRSAVGCGKSGASIRRQPGVKADMATIKKINHIAIAVSDLEESLAFWRDSLGIQMDHIEDVPNQKVRVAFLPVGDGEVELVQPTDDASGTARFIRERGQGLHHLCLEVDDLEDFVADLSVKGVRLINRQAVEMEDRRFVFIHPKSTGGVLIELYELK